MHLKIRAIFALGAIMAIIAGQSSAAASTKPPLSGWMAGFAPASEPAALPGSAFVDERGRRLSFEDFRGRLVLVNFWATWCGPCVREMPSLARLHARLGSTDVAIVALSEDRLGWKKIAPFRAAHGLGNLPMFHDAGSRTMFAAQVGGLPTTILLGRDGRELGRLTGPAEWDSPEAEALIRHYRDRRD